MLCPVSDRFIQFPYQALVPWPVIEYRGQPDWIASVHSVESWLDQCVGPHWQRWSWSLWTLHQQDLCAVSFQRSRDRTLFLLRFGH